MDDNNLIPVVSKPAGNIDECCLIKWLEKRFPDVLAEPEKISRIDCAIEKENEYYIVSSYQTPNGNPYFKVRIRWELEIEAQFYEVWTTVYTSIPLPEDSEDVRSGVLAKGEVIMLVKTYCNTVKAVLDQGDDHHHEAIQSKTAFQMMKHFLVKTTPTGRVEDFVVVTKGGRRYDAKKIVTPYFNIAQINHYESQTWIKGKENDRLHDAIAEEKSGHLSRQLIEYYSWCGKRYAQTFEEAYTRLIDILADDSVQQCLRDLKEMEKGAHERAIPISEIRHKYHTVLRFLARDRSRSKAEFEIMDESYFYIQELIDKFESWTTHPDLSLAQTSLLERKIEDLSQGLGQKRMLIVELRRRFEDIAYWAEWFRRQFPTLFKLIDEEP